MASVSASRWSGPGPEEIAAWNLVQAGHLIGRRFHREFGLLGVTPTQFGVLLHLHLHPDMSNNEIARSVLVTPQSMSELLDSLEALGLIERDPAGGRGHRVAVRLTQAGEGRLERCAGAVDRVQQSLGLSRAQHHRLNEALSIILSSSVQSDSGTG